MCSRIGRSTKMDLTGLRDREEPMGTPGKTARTAWGEEGAFHSPILSQVTWEKVKTPTWSDRQKNPVRWGGVKRRMGEDNWGSRSGAGDGGV
jgi:hypothetical protein